MFFFKRRKSHKELITEYLQSDVYKRSKGLLPPSLDFMELLAPQNEEVIACEKFVALIGRAVFEEGDILLIDKLRKYLTKDFKNKDNQDLAEGASLVGQVKAVKASYAGSAEFFDDLEWIANSPFSKMFSDLLCSVSQHSSELGFGSKALNALIHTIAIYNTIRDKAKEKDKQHQESLAAQASAVFNSNQTEQDEESEPEDDEEDYDAEDNQDEDDYEEYEDEVADYNFDYDDEDIPEEAAELEGKNNLNLDVDALEQKSREMIKKAGTIPVL